MSKLSTLAPVAGSKSSIKRLGRGRGSGLGQTAGKGHKGQLARSGGKVRRGFEGGQTPLIRRLPKVGFTNIFRKQVSIVNISDLARLKDNIVNHETLYASNLIKSKTEYVKLLGDGDLAKPLRVTLNAISESAKKKIELAGGNVEVI
jgi:large subunit ribosomal protein L15